MATNVEVRVDGLDSDSNGYETICWGCKLQLILPRYSPVFKCGYCGAVTVHEKSPKPRSRWSLPPGCISLLDHFLVTFVSLLVLLIIGGGVWTMFPVLFPSVSFGFFFHSTVTAFLAFYTIFNYVLAAFIPAGLPPPVEWGEVEVVDRGGLENYRFCDHCQKPKHPAAHHCRTCKACVMEMDHHCPFIGNCVGANNHRYFILFLVFTMVSCLYVLAMAVYTYNHSTMSLSKTPHHKLSEPVTLSSRLDHLVNVWSSYLLHNEMEAAIRYVGLLYLCIISLALLFAVGLLLCQQLGLVYQGQTYLDSLSAANDGNSGPGKKGWGNLQRFFGQRRGRSPYMGSFRWNKLKQTALKLTSVAFLVAIFLIWRNVQTLGA